MGTQDYPCKSVMRQLLQDTIVAVASKNCVVGMRTSRAMGTCFCQCKVDEEGLVLVQVERRKWRTDQKEWLEEQLPKATGRSALALALGPGLCP